MVLFCIKVQNIKYTKLLCNLKLNSLKINTVIVLILVSQSCPTLCNPTDCIPPGSSVHWDSSSKNTGVGCHALPSRGSSQPSDRTQVSPIAGGFFTI